MSDIYKGELQDYQGNTVYPHTEADIVFCTDGENVQAKIAKLDGALGDVTGATDSLEVSDSNILATSKALNKLRTELGGLKFGIDEDGNYGYIKDGADTVTPFKTGSNILLFTSSPANIKSVLPKIYNQLTASDFLVGVSNFNAWVGGGTSEGSINASVGKSYNASTGILTFSAISGKSNDVTYSTSGLFAIYKGTIAGKE